MAETAQQGQVDSAQQGTKSQRWEVERAARIELASSAWKAEVLPLHNARKTFGVRIGPFI